MTAFNFLLEEKRVCIAMDTLMLRANKKTPFKYISKIFMIPHLNGVICGTGSADFVLKWYLFVQRSIIAKDIEHLDLYASEALQKLAKNSPCGFSVTIYHFGWSEINNKFIGLVYRSTNNFVSEFMHYGLGIKPRINIDSFNELPEDFVKIIKIQKMQDEALQIEDRLGIGGDIHFLVMTEGGFTLSKCHRFDDYEKIYNQMLDNLSEEKC